MSQEHDPTGVPTRAIHEAYLEMQGALKAYRTAKDRGSELEKDDAHGEVQETVLTLYEMLRPHIKHNDSVSGYWEGEPPNYPREGGPPDPKEGKGILQVQQRNDTVDLTELQPEGFDGLDEWHKALELNGSVRLVGVVGQGEQAIIQYQAYQMGLQNLDEWETKYHPTQEDMGGFMSGKKQTTKRRARIDMQRLKRAARELTSVADKLGLLSHVSVDSLDTDNL